MPTTPAQLTEMIASAVATALTNQHPVNRDLFNSAANSGLGSNASVGTKFENLGGQLIRPIINEVPASLYRQTSITNEPLKRSCLSDSNTDNTRRKAAILIILKSEDLLPK